MNKRQQAKLVTLSRRVQALMIVAAAVKLAFDVVRGNATMGRSYVLYPNDSIKGYGFGR